MDRAEQLPLPPTTAGQGPEAEQGGNAPRCANCAAPAPGRYCASCGQETREFRPTVRDFTHDLLEETLSLDSRLIRSLPSLLFRPGQLTSEYLAGRRASYIRPLKLYLAASFVFFLSLSLPMSRPLIRINAASPDVMIQIRADSARNGSALRSNGKGGARSDRFAARATEFVAQGPENVQKSILQGIQDHLPKTMFLLLPFFALLLRILYRRSGRYYGEHVIFALHFHAFLFFALTAAIFSPLAALRSAILGWCLLYLFLALYRVYGQPLWKTTVKFLTLSIVYMMLQSIVGLAIVLAIILL
jgi:hypothetical protein